jgi:hypothetical protein
VQKINNIVQSEQLKHNGRIPESNRSIRLLYIFNMAGHFCLKVLPILCVGLLLTACANKDLSFNPYTTVLNKVIKTQYINNKGE